MLLYCTTWCTTAAVAHFDSNVLFCVVYFKPKMLYRQHFFIQIIASLTNIVIQNYLRVVYNTIQDSIMCKVQ